MPEPDKPRASRYDLAALTRGTAPLGLAAVGGAVVLAALAFAFTAGWLSPRRLTPARMIGAFEAVNGPHPGFRRNHAKGLCFTGTFRSSGQGTALSRATVFEPGRVSPVIGRFALAGGQPYAPDGAKTVRSMAVSFRPAGGAEWRTGMNGIPVFAVRDAQGFYDQLLASRPDPATGKPDPEAMKAFLARHPETARAVGLINARPVSTGFADTSYNGLNAFRFVNAAGESVPVRWSMIAVDPFEPDAGPAASRGGDYLFDALVDRIRRGPAEWRMVATVGAPGDPTADATLAWPADRRRVELGLLSVTAVEAEAAGGCRDINFDPLVLPPGIEPSDDPLLSARSAAYALSFTRRSGEKKSPSAVQLRSPGG